MKSFEIIYGRVPAWYELGWSSQNLIIDIHRNTFDELQTITKFSPIVSNLKNDNDLELPDFVDFKEDSCGFGGVLVHDNSNKRTEWIRLLCSLPIILKSDSRDINWQEAYALVATLKVLFEGLYLVHTDTQYPLPQLLIINAMAVRVGIHGGSFNAMLSLPLCEWIFQQTNYADHTEIVSAMMNAYKHMNQDWESICDKHDFRAHIRLPRWIFLECPGNSCSLDPVDINREMIDEGYELIHHNIDGPLQQLTLLVGLSSLYQIARQDGF